MTRIDAYKYAKQAYKLGVRYIGGCCGFEGRHVRSMSEAVRDIDKMTMHIVINLASFARDTR